MRADAEWGIVKMASVWACCLGDEGDWSPIALSGATGWGELEGSGFLLDMMGTFEKAVAQLIAVAMSDRDAFIAGGEREDELRDGVDVWSKEVWLGTRLGTTGMGMGEANACNLCNCRSLLCLSSPHKIQQATVDDTIKRSLSRSISSLCSVCPVKITITVNNFLRRVNCQHRSTIGSSSLAPLDNDKQQLRIRSVPAPPRGNHAKHPSSRGKCFALLFNAFCTLRTVAVANHVALYYVGAGGQLVRPRVEAPQGGSIHAHPGIYPGGQEHAQGSGGSARPRWRSPRRSRCVQHSTVCALPKTCPNLCALLQNSARPTCRPPRRATPPSRKKTPRVQAPALPTTTTSRRPLARLWRMPPTQP